MHDCWENSMETIGLKVKGMTCGSCVASVERALKGIPGVASVAVDLPGGTASIVTSGNVGVDTLMLALASAGYDSSPRSAGEGPGTASARGSSARNGGCCCR